VARQEVIHELVAVELVELFTEINLFLLTHLLLLAEEAALLVVVLRMVIMVLPLLAQE
jgi:hypothetical protein